MNRTSVAMVIGLVLAVVVGARVTGSRSFEGGDPDWCAVRIGVAAEALAASSGTLAVGEALLERLVDQEQLSAALESAEELEAVAVESFVAAEASLRVDPTDQAAKAAVQARASELAAARAATIAARDALFQAVCAECSSEVVARLVVIRDREASRLPIPFKVAALTPKQRAALEDAFVRVQRASRMGVQPPTAAQQLVLNTLASPQVAAAQVSYNANIAGIQAALGALAGPG